MDIYDARIRTPLAAVVAGPPGCGKTVFIVNLLKNQTQLLNKPIEELVWFYGQENEYTKSLPKILNNIKVRLIQGLPKDFKKYIDPKVNQMYVIDDMMTEITSNRQVTELYSLQCRHTNTSIIILLQNLNYPGRERLTFLRCSHLLVIFSNPLDLSMVSALAKKVMPLEHKTFMEIFREVTNEPYTPLIIDGHQKTPHHLRFRGQIFNGVQHVFSVKKK